MKQGKKGLVWISILVIIEQVIKIIINSKYLDADIEIIPNLVYFNPLFNRDYSWINNLFDLGIGKLFHIIMVIFVLIIIYMFYNYSFNNGLDSKMFYYSYLLIMSGAICSLIDKVFWDGSLDYIYLKNLFTFDLKDAYISAFVAIILLMTIFDKNFTKFIEEKDLFIEIKEYYFKRKG